MSMSLGGAVFVGTTVLLAAMDGGLSATIGQLILASVLAAGTRIALNKANEAKSRGKDKR